MQTFESSKNNLQITSLSYLKELFESFNNKGWKYSISNNIQEQTNNQNHIIFKKDELIEQFQFIINKNEIIVKVPIRSSDNNVIIYSTKFISYYEACEFILMHLEEYK